MRRFASMSAAALVAAGAVAACDLNQIQAEKVAVATILATPPVTVSPLALGGLDAGFDGGVEVPGQTITTVFFGERDNSALDEEPTGIEGATVSLALPGGGSVALDEEGGGNYILTSLQEPDLVYESGQTYRFFIQDGSETYSARVEDVPQLERVSELHPSSGYIDHAAGAPFTFSRPAPPAGQERNLGFVTVFPIDESTGERGPPTYTNVPRKPLDFLKLIVRPSQWKQTTITVPGSAFPQPDSTYALVLQAVKTGGPESDNLFSGSAILAGTAEIGIFRTQ